MIYICPLCGEKVEVLVEEGLSNLVISAIKQEHPDWVEEGGVCPRCVAYYLNVIAGHGGHA